MASSVGRRIEGVSFKVMVSRRAWNCAETCTKYSGRCSPAFESAAVHHRNYIEVEAKSAKWTGRGEEAGCSEGRRRTDEDSESNCGLGLYEKSTVKVRV